MKPINPDARRVVNIRDERAFTPWGGDEEGTSFIKLNPKMDRDVGFYIYRMAPGARSTPHRHGGAEEFYVIEGELTDHDGTVYRTGDVVWLDGGTEHFSTTVNGCTVAVFAEAAEERPGNAD